MRWPSTYDVTYIIAVRIPPCNDGAVPSAAFRPEEGQEKKEIQPRRGLPGAQCASLGANARPAACDFDR